VFQAPTPCKAFHGRACGWSGHQYAIANHLDLYGVEIDEGSLLCTLFQQNQVLPQRQATACCHAGVD
jgi:hypothetical protein